MLYHNILYYIILWQPAPARARCRGHRKGGWYGWKPHGTQIVRFELFNIILLLKFDKRFPVEQFEASASISVSSALHPS